MLELFPASQSEMSPEYIQAKLFSFHNSAHKLHLDTRSYAEHKALDGLYTALVDFKDEISEKLMGYMGGKRIKSGKLDPLPVYSETAANSLVDEIMTFASKLEAWAGKLNYCDLENIAQSLSGEAAKVKYLLTLK